MNSIIHSSDNIFNQQLPTCCQDYLYEKCLQQSAYQDYNDQRRMQQTASAVMMVRPIHFEFNAQTAVDNEFQNNTAGQIPPEYVTQGAMLEFERSVRILREEGIEVVVLEKQEEATDSSSIHTPDAVFPNNWFGTSKDGKIFVYTMATENRRAETRRLSEVMHLLDMHGFQYDENPLILTREMGIECDSKIEAEDVLEGTGAMVIDHINGTVYAAKSVRCSPKALKKFMELRSSYLSEAVLFETKSSTGKEIYHTNVMISIGTNFAVVCSDSIVEHPTDRSCVSRQKVLDKLRVDRTVIEISFEQAEKHFCANILELRGHNNEAKIVMSQAAFNGFTQEQKAQLSKFGKLVPIPISDVIEFVGGGSARCMLAEIHLPKKNFLSGA
jgi:hypothetical protein